MITICHRYTGAVLHAIDADSLVGIRLEGVDLAGADLQGANLQWASLRGARLQGADLQGANLQCADLWRANLQEADLRRANLQEADLRRADLRGATLEDGIRWETYITAVVPALLQAGGRSLAEVLATGCWGCDTWEHGPLAEAFGVHRLEDIPPLYRWQAERFLQFFAAGLLPQPAVA
jgi:hypothetical protein